MENKVGTFNIKEMLEKSKDIKNKNIDICFDEFITNEQYESLTKNNIKNISYNEINNAIKDATDFYKVCRKEMRIIEKKINETKNKLLIDTIMLIKYNFFKDYEEYHRWLMEQTNGITKQFNKDKIDYFNNFYEYNVAIPELDKKTFNYIKTKWGAIK